MPGNITSHGDAQVGRLGVTSAPDWFTVGPTLVLRGQGENSLELDAVGLGGRLGTVVVERRGREVHVATGMGGAAGTEAIRLAVRLAPNAAPGVERVIVRAGEIAEDGLSLLRADGFAPNAAGHLARAVAPHPRADGRRVRTMEDVYSDPYAIPWNFVDREHDVIGLALGATGGGPLRVLDLGCGFGKNATWLEEREHEVWGIDISPTAIARCRELVGEPRNYVAGSATELPWPDGGFDLVLDVGCLHCLPAAARPAGVSEASRVLTPGGALVSRAFRPRPDWWLAAQPFAADGFGLEPEAVRTLLAGSFEHVEIRTTDALTYAVAR